MHDAQRMIRGWAEDGVDEEIADERVCERKMETAGVNGGEVDLVMELGHGMLVGFEGRAESRIGAEEIRKTGLRVGLEEVVKLGSGFGGGGIGEGLGA